LQYACNSLIKPTVQRNCHKETDIIFDDIKWTIQVGLTEININEFSIHKLVNKANIDRLKLLKKYSS
jgi:hypothetical protein